jgi:hypothetical protein
MLELKLVGHIAGCFFVPAYQRGYRWGELEVKKLLNDIWDSNGEDYNLQPVVVKPHIPGGQGGWELIDGQQRLMTLYLIFHFMQREALQHPLPPYSLGYDTRPGIAAYLEALDAAQSNTTSDNFHLFQAYGCITDWFNAFGGDRQLVANKFYGYLFESVRVIWYQAPPGLDAMEIFIRLNIGRIPLTDAELVKALLLSRRTVGARRDARALEMAAEWDSIERDLRQPDLWAFISNTDSDDRATHIDLLLDTLADAPAGDLQPYATFNILRNRIEDQGWEDIWNQVVDMHALVRGWFDDPSLYHKIGYLTAVKEPFRNLVRLAQEHTRSSFETALNALIKAGLGRPPEGRTPEGLTPSDLTTLSYENAADRKICERVLLLMNAETILRRNDCGERYSFRRHREAAWSLEHIHAQNAEGLTKAEQWRVWLGEHRNALADLPGVDNLRRDELLNDIDAALALAQITRQLFDNLAPQIIDIFTLNDANGVRSVHSLTNLALLSSGANSALNNAVFEVKRRRILKLDRQGDYIPICTRHVFLKYYTDADAQQIHFWSLQDRENYLAAMRDLLAPYLAAEDPEA